MTPTIGAALIARNAEATLRQCLESLAPHVDQLVIALVGPSTDQTEAIAREFTSEVYQFESADIRDGKLWDFSSARNFSFSFLHTDWFMWLDADDTLVGGERLRETVEAAERSNIGCLHFLYEYRHDEQGHPTVEQTRERLVKSSLGWSWRYRVHEILESTSPHTVGKPDNIKVVHHASESHSVSYLPILESMYKEDPTDPRILQILGDTYAGAGDFERAKVCLENAFLSTGHDDVRWTIATNLARFYIREKDWPKAEQWCFTAISLHPEYSLSYLLLATISWHGYNDSTRALQYFEDADQDFRTPAPLVVHRQQDDYTINRWDVEWRCYADQEEWVHAWSVIRLALQYRGVGAPTVGKTPDPWFFSAWYVFERMKCEDSVEGTISLVDHLCRRGDTLRARKLMEECLPLPIREDKRIVAAYERIKQFTAHVQLGNDEQYKAFYEGNHNSEDSMNGTDYEPYRMNTILRRLQERGAKKVLDVGCGAGGPAMFLAEHGINVVGLDINEPTVKYANKLARKAKTKGKARFICGSYDTHGPEDLGKFDAVLMLELLEHIHPTQVPFYLSSAEDFLKPGGAVFATTPGMAIGDIPGIWDEFPRDHVQEFSRQDLERLILTGASRRVKKPINLYRIYDPEVSVPGFASWFMEYEWSPPEEPGENWEKPVVIYTGPGLEEWTPQMPDERGLGGSETWAAKTAKELRRRGHPVVVYGMATGVWDGVIYRHHSLFNPAAPFVGATAWLVLVSRQLGALDTRPAAETVLFLAHDVDYGEELTPARLANMDRYCVLSQWQEHHTENQYHGNMLDNVIEKLALFSNAIEPEFFGGDTHENPKVPHSFIWSSSPDRGLDQLLEWWPSIRNLWPDATLNIYYGWDNVDAMMDSRPWLRPFKQRVLAMSRQPGVTWHGRIGQRELAQRAMQTQFWLYPSQLPAELGSGPWHETFCITALEMQAAGVIPIYPDRGALPERFYFGSLVSDEDWSLSYVLEELERWDKLEVPDVRHLIEHDWGFATDLLLDLCAS